MSDTGKQVIWFNISGAIGTVIFNFFYEGLLRVWPSDFKRATVCWAVSYFVSIIWQHALHRYLVFGTGSPYLRSLVYTYTCYTLSIVLSTIINDVVFIQYLGLSPSKAFYATLIATGFINYFTVRNAFQTDEKKTEKQAESKKRTKKAD
eukprot:comp87909_c0_seq1/m.48520 comp87909_c0_seq1/g.48520  ORF comp87909_c0_seq1/g.48520 comp87909_c0_seq1/m.48520 type:complete len:149 (-) comp87909_c0_seq1:26-472(-)